MHHHFAHTSNTQIIQISKLVDGIKLSDADIRYSNNNRFSSESNNKEQSEPDKVHNPTLLNKITEGIKDLCDTCIKSKHTRIIKHKVMTLTIQKLEEIYVDF